MESEVEVDLDWTREFPILFQMRRLDGTVLIQHYVTSNMPWFSPAMWDMHQIDDIDSLVVEYKLPGAEVWKLAKVNPWFGWTVDEGNHL